MKILIVEDEPKIASLLGEYFQRDGFSCLILNEGTHAVETALNERVDLVVLDLMLPGKDGLTICRELRQRSAVPILMLTAREDELDRLLGLELGADDYVCKPFSPREVVARARAILRRANKTIAAPAQTLSYQQLQLVYESFSCTADGAQVELTPVEFKLLWTLLSAPGRIFTRPQLMDAIYTDQRIVSDRTIDSHLRNIRKKLLAHLDHDPIQAIYGVGYKLQG